MTVGGDVEESLVWRGPFRSLPRDLSAASLRSLITAIAWLIGIGLVAVLPDVLGLTSLHGRQRLGMRVAFLIAVTLTAGLFAVARASTRGLEVVFPGLAAALFLTGPVLVNLAVVLVGPDFGGVTVFFVELLLIAFLVLRRSWAVAVTVFTLALYVVALDVLDNPPSPQLQFINVLAAAVATGVLMGAFTNRLDDTRRELAFMNAHLEDRVEEQVRELERTGRLRRFLSPQVAEVVTSEGAEALLAPHRADIAVFFVDLRGFSAFANAASPERVMEVLDSYYDAVGRVLDAHGATIGGFDGDGVFAYLGDPVARPDAAPAAVRIACEVARSLDVRTTEWSQGGLVIGYGIGLAFGQATLGSVGFAGRSDYTPVGPVVNLAARLCADAQHREIVIDDAMRTAAGLANGAVMPRRDVDLKGFGITRTFAVGH
ncbi:MAG TPA: adenylate/guanylate cyclase domain-containing protein [Acidimicrobiales bacterium]|nr:adenylate/guanylate cyclase domain-containing protein [Acidimicrobiales bacterium]